MRLARSAGASSPAGGTRSAATPLRVSNVVFMGMGEALANYKAAIGAIRRLVDPAPDGLGMSARGITMSTVGLVPAVDKLAAEGIPVTLALSLHAPDDELRNELVPINTRWSVDEAIDAAYRYFQATKRRVSIEYALIRDINDQAWRADLLGRKLTARGKGWVHVNPIPLNPTPGSKWTASRPGVEQQFVERLRAAASPRRSGTRAVRTSTAPAANWLRPPPERASRLASPGGLDDVEAVAVRVVERVHRRDTVPRQQLADGHAPAGHRSVLGGGVGNDEPDARSSGRSPRRRPSGRGRSSRPAERPRSTASSG